MKHSVTIVHHHDFLKFVLIYIFVKYYCMVCGSLGTDGYIFLTSSPLLLYLGIYSLEHKGTYKINRAFGLNTD